MAIFLFWCLQGVLLSRFDFFFSPSVLIFYDFLGGLFIDVEGVKFGFKRQHDNNKDDNASLPRWDSEAETQVSLECEIQHPREKRGGKGADGGTKRSSLGEAALLPLLLSPQRLRNARGTPGSEPREGVYSSPREAPAHLSHQTPGPAPWSDSPTAAIHRRCARSPRWRTPSFAKLFLFEAPLQTRTGRVLNLNFVFGSRVDCARERKCNTVLAAPLACSCPVALEWKLLGDTGTPRNTHTHTHT